MKLTYAASVRQDWDNDRTVVTIRGSHYSEPLEGADQAAVKGAIRRAVRHLFCVDGMELAVEHPDRIHHPGDYVVTATA